MSVVINNIIFDIGQELEKAKRKFPEWPTDPIHAAMIVAEESGELMKEILQMVYEPHKTDIDKVRKEALQTAAMCVRFIESLDNKEYEFEESFQHYQSDL